MTRAPTFDRLPSGYFVEESPGGVLVLHSGVARELHELGYGPESDGALARSELSGRKPLYELRTSTERLVVRRFSHGGLLRWLTGARFLDPARPFRELVLADALRRAGIRTPQVVAARARRLPLVGWQLDLVSRLVPDAVDLGYLLGRARRGELQRSALRRVLLAAGELVRQLHRNGCLHADLTPNNLLVELETLQSSAPALWVLDLDRSVLRAELGDERRRHNLRRLFRHVQRREARLGASLSTTDYARFLRGYDPERRRWKADWRAVRKGHSRRRLAHALGWFLEGRFSPGADPRDDPDLLLPPAQRRSG